MPPLLEIKATVWKGMDMKKIALVAIPLLLVGCPALAGTEQGSGALSLSALVAEYSPAVKAAEKALLLKYLEGDAKAAHAPGKKINVNAELVTCRISDVDITAHSCELAFGAKKDTIKGRKAHELYATLVEIGVPFEGAAGSIIEAISNLECTVDPDEVKQGGGGGAHCKYDPAK
jgi:hypothetical protein